MGSDDSTRDEGKPAPAAPGEPAPSLESRHVAERVLAVGQLADGSSASDLDRLMDMATSDRSPSVRLAAAAAASEILYHYHLPETWEGVPRPQREALLARLRGLDPGANIGLLQVLSVVGLPEVPGLLARAFRDPRADVRMGAMAGLGRLGASAAANGDAAARDLLTGLLRDTKLRPEISVEVIRLATSLGAVDCREDLVRLCERLPSRLQVQTAPWLERLDRLADSRSLYDLWIDEGLDAGMPDTSAAVRESWLILPGYVIAGRGNAFPVFPADWSATSVALAAVVPSPVRPWRRIEHRYKGQDQVELLQVGLQTFSRAEERDLARFVVLLADEKGVPRELRHLAFEVLGPRCSAKPSGQFIQGVLAFWAGDPQRAIGWLGPLAPGGKLPVEVLWYQGQTWSLLGARDRAVELWRAYLKKAGKKALFGREARARLGEE